MTGIVYYGDLGKESLKKLIVDFFSDDTFHISQDIAHYVPKTGLPQEITSEGRVFSEKGEIRWKEENGRYQTLLLTEVDQPVPLGLTKINREWDVEPSKIFLVPPKAPHITPNFEKYPRAGENPKLDVVIYKDKERITFISPRRFTNE